MVEVRVTRVRRSSSRWWVAQARASTVRWHDGIAWHQHRNGRWAVFQHGKRERCEVQPPTCEADTLGSRSDDSGVGTQFAVADITATACSISSRRIRRAYACWSSSGSGTARSTSCGEWFAARNDSDESLSPAGSPMNRSQIAVLVLAAANFVALLPKTYGATSFAFGDKGWPLTVDTLLDEGLNPVTGFGYFYGLLTLSVDRTVFAVLGRTPAGTRDRRGLRPGRRDRAGASMRVMNMTGAPAMFLAACTPFAVMPILFPSPAHAIEAALLANALAFHLAGRFDRGPRTRHGCGFVKPSLGYVYGFLLLVFILVQRSDRRLTVATVTAGGRDRHGFANRARGGVRVGAGTPHPDAVRRDEGLPRLGIGLLFGSGREFWWPAERKPLFHLLTPVGVWIASSVVLFVLAVRLLPWALEPVPTRS